MSHSSTYTITHKMDGIAKEYTHSKLLNIPSSFFNKNRYTNKYLMNARKKNEVNTEIVIQVSRRLTKTVVIFSHPPSRWCGVETRRKETKLRFTSDGLHRVLHSTHRKVILVYEHK